MKRIYQNIIEDYIVSPSKIMSLYHNLTQVDLDNQDKGSREWFMWKNGASHLPGN